MLDFYKKHNRQDKKMIGLNNFILRDFFSSGWVNAGRCKNPDVILRIGKKKKISVMSQNFTFGTSKYFHFPSTFPRLCRHLFNYK